MNQIQEKQMGSNQEFDIPVGRLVDELWNKYRVGTGLRVCHKIRYGRGRMDHVTITEWERVGSKSYPRNRNLFTVESHGSIAGDVLTYTVSVFGTFRIRAPRGWEWARDENGLALKNIKTPDMDFHPTGATLVKKYAARRIVREARDNYKTRQKLLREEKKRKRESEIESRKNIRLEKIMSHIRLYVCFSDSVRAGNCATGTKNWAETHGLDLKTHIPADVLERIDPNNPRVSVAIAAARKRTLTELMRGFSNLSDHRL